MGIKVRLRIAYPGFSLCLQNYLSLVIVNKKPSPGYAGVSLSQAKTALNLVVLFIIFVGSILIFLVKWKTCTVLKS